MYQYRECGLDNIYLANGFTRTQTADGKEVVVIDDVRGLHAAIREGIVDLARELTPREFRFLRREMDFSQRQLAMIIGVEEQTVSLWERGNNNAPIPASAQLILRTWVRECDSERPALRQLTERLNALDREIYALESKSLEFSRDGSNWVQQKVAA